MKSYEIQIKRSGSLNNSIYCCGFNIIGIIWNNVCIQCNKIYIRDLVIFRHFIPLKLCEHISFKGDEMSHVQLILFVCAKVNLC